MKGIAVLIVLGAWMVVVFAPPKWLAKILNRIFASFGIAMVFLGAFSYWVDGSIRPEQQNASLFVCGLLTLAAWACSSLRNQENK